MTDSTPSTGRPRRRLRRWALIVVALLVVLLVGVALLPTLVNRGLAQGTVRAAIEKHLNGTVDIGSLELGWFGTQHVKGLTLTDVGGLEAADLNLSINTGLAALLLGNVDELVLDVGGTLRGTLNEDGSTSFGDLLASGTPSDEPSGPVRTEPVSLGGVPATTLNITNLNVEVDDPASGRTMALRNLTGSGHYRPGGVTDLVLAGTTETGDRTGTIDVNASLPALFNDAGLMTPEPASADVTLTLDSAPLPVAGLEGHIETLTFMIKSDSLVKVITTDIDGRAILDGGAASTLDGHLEIRDLFDADGAVVFAPENITGSITGSQVPTGLLAALVSDYGIDPTRDIGATAQLNAEFGSGATRAINIGVEGEHAELRVAAAVDTESGALTASEVHLDATARPEMLAAWTEDLTLAAPAGLTLNLDRVELPATDDNGDRPLGALGLGGTLTFKDPVTIVRASAPDAPLNATDLRLVIDVPSLASGGTITTFGTIDGAELIGGVTVTDLIDTEGDLDLAAARPAGEISLIGLPPETLAAHLPDQADLIRAAETGAIDITMLATENDQRDELVLGADVTSAGLNLNITAARPNDTSTLSVRIAAGEVRLTPALVAALQGDGEDTIVLLEPAEVSFHATPFDLDLEGEEALATPLEVQLTGTDTTLLLDRVPGLANPVGARNLDATAVLDGGALSLNGAAELQTRDATRIADATFDMTTHPETGLARAEAVLKTIDVPALDRAMSDEPGRLTPWLGESGDLSVSMTPNDDGFLATVQSTLPRLQGTYTLDRSETTTAITATEPTIILGKDKLAELLVGAPEPGLPPAMYVDDDVTLQPTIRALQVPNAMLAGDAFDPALLKLDVEVTGSPLKLRTPERVQYRLRKSVLRLRSDRLDQGVSLTLDALVRTRLPEEDTLQEAGAVRVEGRADNLVANGEMVSMADATWQASVNADALPAAVIDHVASLEGKVGAMLGDRVRMTLNTADLSRDGGTLDVLFAGPEEAGTSIVVKGEIESAPADPRDADQTPHRILRLADEPTPSANLLLSEPLRREMLSSIHPFLDDIEPVTSRLITLTFTGATIPLSGRPEDLNGTMRLDIGDVRYKSTGEVKLLLDLLDRRRRAETLNGRVGPIVATIDRGVMTYQTFSLVIDDYQLDFSGTVDLVQRVVDLRAELPFDAFSEDIEELRRFSGGAVPFTLRGPIGNASFNLAVDQLIERNIGNAIGGALDDLIRKNLGDDDDDEKDDEKKNDDKKKNNKKKNDDDKKKKKKDRDKKKDKDD